MGKRVIVRDAGPDAMLYDPERDELHVLNATARLIHRLSREGKGAAEIEEALRESFAIPPGADLRAQIAYCLAALEGKGL